MQARRAAAPDDNIEEIEPTRTPQRAQGSRVRIVVAPLALAAVAGILSMASLLPNAAHQTEPLEQATSRSEIASRQLSRSAERTSLLPISPTPSASATVTPPSSAAASTTPSASATPSVSATAAPSASATPTASASAASTPATPQETAPAPSPTPSSTAPAPAAAAAPKATPAPAPKIPALGSDAGALYVTGSVNVRTGPGKGYDSLTVLSAGSKVTATDVVVDGWQQVNRKGTAGWVRASFLSAEAPVAEVAEKSSGAKSGAKCSKAGDLESKLTQRTVEVLRAVCANFPGVSSYGGYRAGDSGYHGSGQAIDVMISGDAGWEIAKWARSNASDLGVIEVIYEQKIWTTQRSGDGWRSMSDRGSVSANHYDHVHLSVR